MRSALRRNPELLAIAVLVVMIVFVVFVVTAQSKAQAQTQTQTAYAIVDQRSSIIVDWPSDVLPPGQIRQYSIFPDQASAASQMVEWADEKIDVSQFKIVPVTVTRFGLSHPEETLLP